MMSCRQNADFVVTLSQSRVRHHTIDNPGGDEQLEGLDFHETFFPVVKWLTMRTVISMAAMQGWKLHHLDVKCAFLNEDLEGENVYLHQPSGYISPGFEKHVCLLN